MNKSTISQLAKALSEKSSLKQAEAESFVKLMFDVVNEALQSDKQVKVKWLGTFKVTSVKDRESVDVNTGERIVIEGRDKVTFTPDTILKEIVNKPFSQFETVVVNDGVDFSAIDEKFAAEDKEAIEALSASQEPEEEEDEQVVEVQDVSYEIPQQPMVVAQTDNTAKTVNTVNTVNTAHTDTANNTANTVHENETSKPRIADEVSDIVSDEVSEQYVRRGYMVLPRYLVFASVVLVLALVGAFGWFAFNYGKLQAQRDHLTMQLSEMLEAEKAKPKPATPQIDTAEVVMKQKAMEDSARMAEVSKAVDAAEQADQSNAPTASADKEKAGKSLANKENSKTSDGLEISDEKNKKSTANLNNDSRLRTGAYTIVGVAQVVTVKSGQTLSSISKKYLGPGMDCYVEAINGTKEVHVGQRVKIPSLKLKKK